MRSIRFEPEAGAAVRVTTSAASDTHNVEPVLFWVGTATEPAAMDTFMAPEAVRARPLDAGVGHRAASSRRSTEPAYDPACNQSGVYRVMSSPSRQGVNVAADGRDDA